MLDLGNARVHWLDGGEFRSDGGAMFGPVPKVVWSQRYPCDDQNMVPLATRPLLFQLGQEWVLVDGGFGHHLSERQRKAYNLVRAGALEESLARLGLTRESISWVVVTHLHLDHGSGLVRTGDGGRLEPMFPRARHVVQRIELEEQSHPHEREKHAYELASWQPLEDAGLVEVVEGQREVLPGLEVFLTGGHSRGHQGLRLQAAGTSLLHLGDVLPTSVHLRPLWVSALDDYPMDSIEVKRQWLGQAAQQGWWIGYYHDIRVLAGHCTAEFKSADEVTAVGD